MTCTFFYEFNAVNTSLAERCLVLHLCHNLCLIIGHFIKEKERQHRVVPLFRKDKLANLDLCTAHHHHQRLPSTLSISSTLIGSSCLRENWSNTLPTDYRLLLKISSKKRKNNTMRANFQVISGHCTSNAYTQ